ncbi:hypothetical protein ACE6H2_026575 [Prunus campanulata]
MELFQEGKPLESQIFLFPFFLCPPWTFNHYLLVMTEADDVIDPSRIPLHKQEFWIQVRGLPLVFMTAAMGKEIGTALGNFVVTDQSKRNDCYGSYLRIRVGIDISKPLRRCMPVRLPGGQTTTQWVDLRYEKLPHTCYLCGKFDHIEKECAKFNGDNKDDMAKPYGKWFQEDVYGPDFRKPQGCRSGLSSPMAWLRRGPSDSMSEEEEAPVNPNAGGRGSWDDGDSTRVDLDSPLGPINDPMMGTVTNHDSTLIASETFVGGVAVEENQLLPDLNVRGEAEEKEKLIGAINAGLVVPTVADCNTDSTHSPNGIAADQHGPKVIIEQQRGFMENIAQEDPFGLSPIIQRITKEAKMKSKRPHAGRKISRPHNSTKSPHDTGNTGILNKTAKRVASSTDITETTQGQKRRCLPSVSSSSSLRSVGAGGA